MSPVAASVNGNNNQISDMALDNVQVSGKTNKRRNIIIWDWDDTLLCSSFLSAEGFNLNSNIEHASSEMLRQLDELQKSIISVICLAATFGEVHIVTNAETGWVQMSAQKFVPEVVPYLDKCIILSARSTYECMHPDSPLKWKFYAFQERLATALADLETEKNVLSFGDSHVEREAIRAVTRGHSNCKTKSIKFAERPSIEQLQRQIELVTNCFQYIHDHDGDLDLCMSLSVSPPAGFEDEASQLQYQQQDGGHQHQQQQQQQQQQEQQQQQQVQQEEEQQQQVQQVQQQQQQQQTNYSEESVMA